jgi:hypothetical protein
VGKRTLTGGRLARTTRDVGVKDGVKDGAATTATATDVAEGALAQAGEGLPRRDEMEQSFGRRFDDVQVRTGAAELKDHGIQAVAHENQIAFADDVPSTPLIAHELTHVVQQGQAGGGAAAASSLASTATSPAEVEADAVADTVASGRPASSIAIGATPSAVFHLKTDDGGGKAGGKTDAPPDDPDKSGRGDGRPDILGWAGSTPLRDVRTLPIARDYNLDGDLLAMRAEYAFALQGDREVGSSAVYAVNREMAFEFHGGVKGVVDVKSRAHLTADKAPNDIQASVHASAVWASHDAGIAILEPESFQLLRTQKHTKGQSLEDLIADDKILSFDATPQERIDALRARYHKVRERDRGDNYLARLSAGVQQMNVALSEHAEARRNWLDGNPQILNQAEEWLRQIEKERARRAGNIARGGKADADEKEQLERIEKLYASLYNTWMMAKQAKPPKLEPEDYAWMVLSAPLKATGELLKGGIELGLMGADLIRWAGAEALGAAGVEIEWGAWSSIGKAYQSGKSTGEIVEAMWDGFFDRLDKAFEQARNGNPNALIDIIAEVGVDFALGAVTGGVGTAASWTAKAGKWAERAAEAAKLLKLRAAKLLKDAKALAKNTTKTLKAWAVRQVEGFEQMLEQLVEAFDGVQVNADGTLAGRFPDGNDGKRMLERSRLEVARDEAVADLHARGAGKGKGATDVDDLSGSLQALAEGIKGGEGAMTEVFEHMRFVKEPKKYLKAIEKLNNSNIEADDLVAVLRRSTEMADETAFLDDALWVTKQTISAKARKNLLQKAAAGKAPDLDWLRRTSLSEKYLEYLAENNATNWKTFQKASDEPSDMFPKALEGDEAVKAGIDAAGKVRGVAAELVVKNLKLPDGFKIHIDQVGVDGKIIDFSLIDRAGNTALLEVKGWTKDRWKRQLDVWFKNQDRKHAGKRLKSGDEAVVHALSQLKKATGTGRPVYLAVSDSLPPQTRELLRMLLEKEKLPVKLLYFSEEKLMEMSRELKAAMALGAGVAMFLDDAESVDPGEEHLNDILT